MLGGLFVSESDTIRIYISTLRSEQKISQDDVADAINLARRTYKAWELGETKDIKWPAVVRAVKFLGGASEHLGALTEATEEEAKDLAMRWAHLTPTQRQQIGRIESKFRRVIELGDNDPARLEQTIQRLRADAQADPVILDLVIAWLDGRRSR